MRFRTLVVVAGMLAAVVPTPAVRAADDTVGLPRTWSIDPSRSEVRFTVTKLGFENVTGVFREFDGEIQYDPDRPEASRVRWRVRVASVLTDASNRDSALQQREYFDAARYPYLEFSSQAVRRIDAGRLEVSGPITMRGVTQPITFVVRCMPGDPPRFEADFTVDRYDFGIAGGTVMGRLIGRTVRVRLVAAVRSNPGLGFAAADAPLMKGGRS
jgi:polyisoprenoid-binding protein YceI